MCMAQRHGQRICRIGAWRLRQPEQDLHHVRYLLLVGRPGTHHCLLDLPGRIFMDCFTTGEHGAQRRATSLSQFQGTVHALVHEHPLYRHLVGSMLAHHLAELLEQAAKPCRKFIAFGADITPGDRSATVRAMLYDAKARDTGAGIDAQYAQRCSHKPPALASGGQTLEDLL